MNTKVNWTQNLKRRSIAKLEQLFAENQDNLDFVQALDKNLAKRKKSGRNRSLQKTARAHLAKICRKSLAPEDVDELERLLPLANWTYKRQKTANATYQDARDDIINILGDLDSFATEDLTVKIDTRCDHPSLDYEKLRADFPELPLHKYEKTPGGEKKILRITPNSADKNTTQGIRSSKEGRCPAPYPIDPAIYGRLVVRNFLVNVLELDEDDFEVPSSTSPSRSSWVMSGGRRVPLLINSARWTLANCDRAEYQHPTVALEANKCRDVPEALYIGVGLGMPSETTREAIERLRRSGREYWQQHRLIDLNVPPEDPDSLHGCCLHVLPAVEVHSKQMRRVLYPPDSGRRPAFQCWADEVERARNVWGDALKRLRAKDAD